MIDLKGRNSEMAASGNIQIKEEEQRLLEEQEIPVPEEPEQEIPPGEPPREPEIPLELEELKKRLLQNVTYCFRILFILLALVLISALCLITSAFPAFGTKSNQVDLGDISEGLNGSGVITIDDKVSTVQLTLIQPLRDDVQVNILTSSNKPPLSFTTLKENIQIDVPLKGKFRAGCNILLYDEPIYLQPNSQLKYEITSSNTEVMHRLCYFNNSNDYTKYLNDDTFEYDSKFCFNISDGNAIIDITIKEASPYYVTIDTGGNTSFSVDITIIRSYYNIKMVQNLSSHCSLNESSNFSCIIKICDKYLCGSTKNRYIIVETSHHIVLKYDTLITFYFKPTDRVIFFSFSMIFETIAIIIAAITLIMIYKLWKKKFNGKESEKRDGSEERIESEKTKLKCTFKGVIIAIIVLFVMVLHLIAIAFATINTYDLLVNSNNQLVGNMYPVLLNSQGFNKSVSNVEITLSFPSAESVSVYKVPCNSLKTSSTKLGPKHVIVNLPTNRNSRTSFNFNYYNIPLNLAPGSTVTYSIESTLPFNSSTCISLVFMNSIKAYDEFLYKKQTNFTNYVFHSDCLTNGNTTVKNFTVKDEQNDYYVGIETNIGNGINIDLPVFTVSAEVSVVQVYYDLSNTEVYTSLSVNKTSCNVRVCEKFFCLDQHHVCILVNSTSFDFISYSSHPTFAFVRSTFGVFCLLAIVCTFFLILLISSVSFGYCIKKKDAVRRKILSNKKRSILISIFIGIMIFEGVFIPIILSYSIKIYGKTWINNTKDFVLVNLDQTGSIKWVDTYDIAFSVETDSANSSDISLYTINHHSYKAVPSTYKNKIECKNFSSSCVLNEFIYLVKAEENYVNYNISLLSNISDLPFRVSTFDDYEQYENFRAKKLYTPLQSSLFYGNETFNFNFSSIYMKQEAAYYHFVLHPAFQTDLFTHTDYYYTSSSVQMEISISHYKLNNNYRPHCNITENSTSICRSSIKDDIRVVARANMLTKPILLVAATTTNVPLAVFVAVVPALVVIIFVIIVFAFMVWWKSRFKGYQSLSTRSFDDFESAGRQSTRQDDSEEQPGSECEVAQKGQLVRDSQQSDELATDDESAKEDDELAKKDDQTNKLEGVHVAGKKSFLIQNNLPKLLNWEEYGLRITVPEGAVSPSETIEVSITALVSGEFILPEDSELVSAVYIITVSKPLLKQVLLEIQHCVSIETSSHANYLSFVTSLNDRCPFQFQLVDEGSFQVGYQYGKIWISEFSPWAIVKNLFRRFHPNLIQTTVSQSNTSQCEAVIRATTLPPSSNNTGESANPSTQDKISLFYFAQALYQNKSTEKQWLLMFLFGRDLDALKMYMMKEYRSAERDENFPFRFESSGGFLEIHTNTEKCSEGWLIVPHMTESSSMESTTKITKVSQSTIDVYGGKNPPRFPERLFSITVTSGSNYSNPEIITFHGIICDNSAFNIILPMGDHLMQDPVKGSCSTQQSQTDPKKIFREQYGALFDLMTPDNIAAIANKLYSKELISHETLQNCMTETRKPAERAHSLLNALRATIDQPDVLKSFIEVLKENVSFRSIAEEMERKI